MRVLITGAGSDGRSCVVDDREVAFGAGPFIEVAALYSTASSPAPPRPPGHGEFIDLHIAPGFASFIMVDYEPGATTQFHHTDTIDFEVVVRGSISINLDDGPHELMAGDCVVVNGVDHSWTAGPEGCRFACINLGTPPPAKGRSGR